MNNKIILPDEIWKYILSLLSCHNKYNLVKNILNYYNEPDKLIVNLNSREKILKLLNIALKYDFCVNLLNIDYYFNQSYLFHKNNNKIFLNMDWANSLIISVWMFKYH